MDGISSWKWTVSPLRATLNVALQQMKYFIACWFTLNCTEQTHPWHKFYAGRSSGVESMKLLKWQPSLKNLSIDLQQWTYSAFYYTLEIGFLVLTALQLHIQDQQALTLAA